MGDPTARRLGRASLSLLATALLLVGVSSAAFAQYPPAAGLSVVCTPENPSPLDEVTCTVSGAPAGTDLDILVELLGVTLLDTTVTTDGDGEASFSFTVPEDASAGDTITITITGDEIEGSLVLTLVISDVAPAVPVDDLTRTGTDTGPLLLVGLVTAAVGIGTLAFSRRRGRVRVDA